MGAVMIQGTGSDVGKSVLVAGLCRLFANRGVRVLPFKPQNMSNNAAVTDDGGEIGRAQALQAIAARAPASVDMNPVLLKPQSDRGAQLIVHGRMRGEWRAEQFGRPRPALLDAVMESYRRLRGQADLVIVEGAGSPAETNLRAGDIANMGFARVAGVPVILAGDIDRGGVIASLVGTHAVLEPEDRAMVRAFLVNKFRGDPTLFDAGMATIAERTGWRPLGLVPWIAAARRLPAEDAVLLDNGGREGGGIVRIAVPLLPRIANFDDLDPLRLEPAVSIAMVPPGKPLPVCDLIILPGSKATIADLAFLRAQGWDVDIAAHVRRGGHVLGLCAGYQMLGREISDPGGIEGPPATSAGLGLLDVRTELTGAKTLARVDGQSAIGGAPFEGYEMHVGATDGPDRARPLLTMADGRSDGAMSADGRIAGCYVHGLFARAEQRASLLARYGASSSGDDYGRDVDAALDELAEVLEGHLDISSIAGIAEEAAPTESTLRRNVSEPKG